MSRLSGLSATATWNPASTLDGDETAVDVTVPGAKLGDFVFVSFSLDITDMILGAEVSAANTVAVTLSNTTGGTVDLGSGTLRVLVVPYDDFFDAP